MLEVGQVMPHPVVQAAAVQDKAVMEVVIPAAVVLAVVAEILEATVAPA